MLSWKHRFAVKILFVIAGMLCSDSSEMAQKIRSLEYDFKADYPKPADPDAVSEVVS